MKNSKSITETIPKSTILPNTSLYVHSKPVFLMDPVILKYRRAMVFNRQYHITVTQFAGEKADFIKPLMIKLMT